MRSVLSNHHRYHSTCIVQEAIWLLCDVGFCSVEEKDDFIFFSSIGV